MEKLLRRGSDLFAWIGGIALVVMMLEISADVILRTLFNKPLPLTVEIVSYYYMVAVVFMPMALVEFTGHHISVNLVTQHLKKPAKLTVQFIAMAAALVYFALMTFQTGRQALESLQMNEYLMGAFALPTWPGRFTLPLGCGVYCLVLIVRLVQVCRGVDIDAEFESDSNLTEGA